MVAAEDFGIFQAHDVDALGNVITHLQIFTTHKSEHVQNSEVFAFHSVCQQKAAFFRPTVHAPPIMNHQDVMFLLPCELPLSPVCILHVFSPDTFELALGKPN